MKYVPVICGPILLTFYVLFSLNRDGKWLAWFEEMFTQIAGEDRQISLEEFKTVLKVSKVYAIAYYITLCLSKASKDLQCYKSN